MSKSEVIANFSKKKQIKGGKVGLYLNNDGGKYLGKAVFDGDEGGKFLGKYVSYSHPNLKYLPAGLQDEESNYEYKNISPVYFKEKLSVNKLLGISTRNQGNPDNYVDYDEYLKKSRISKVEDNSDWGVQNVVEEKPVRTIGGKTKRRKQNRRTNKRRKNRTKRM